MSVWVGVGLDMMLPRVLNCVYVHVCACTCRSLEPVESVALSERVNRLVGGEVGVWVSFRSSSLLVLYHAHHALPLLSIDYCTLLPALQTDSEQVGNI